jgi:hypothetical protein
MEKKEVDFFEDYEWIEIVNETNNVKECVSEYNWIYCWSCEKTMQTNILVEKVQNRLVSRTKCIFCLKDIEVINLA